tara:strand:- start:1553 stop:6877 length:5325 start_codon:yes stop_codon:yes gene_type:complete
MSHIPAQGPYVDTLIIDCSRSTSEEVKGDPTNDQNAVFTNKLGNGIKLNPGDKISVSSAYISERGVGGSVIEFKGVKAADQTYTLYESVISKPQLPNMFPTDGASTAFQNLANPRNLHAPTPFADFGPLGAKKVIHTKTAKTFQLLDNEMNVEISFYKTTNGEGYMHLPRRYDMKAKTGQPQTVGGAPAVARKRQPYEFTENMLGQAELDPTVDESVDYDCPFNGRATISPRVTKCCPADWYLYQGLDDQGVFPGVPLNTRISGTEQAPGPEVFLKSVCPLYTPRSSGLWDVDSSIAPKLYRQVGHDGHAFQSYQMKQKNDNSRYTIYAKDVCYYAEYVGDQPGPAMNGSHADSATAPKPVYEIPNSFAETYPTETKYGTPYLSRDDFRGTEIDDGGVATFDINYDKEPACSGYTRYSEIKNLKVPKGFNSPSNVAETLTNQLNQTKEQRIIHGVSGTYLGPYKENVIGPAPINAPSTQGAFDCREYNQNSAYNGFYTDDSTDGKITESTYGTTLTTGQRQIKVSTVLESETLKSFACGNMDTWSEANFIGYRGGDPRDVGADATGDRVVAEAAIPWKIIPPRPAITTLANVGTANMETSSWSTKKYTTADGSKLTEIKPPTVQNVQYLSNYQYIGVKRPELFDSYREFWKPQLESTGSWRFFDALQNLTGMDVDEFPDHPFITTMDWTDANLLRFKAVFDAQAKYPEIFEGYEYSNIESPGGNYNRVDHPDVAKGVSPDYMRFIHVNSWSGSNPNQKGAYRPDAATPVDSNLPEDFPVYSQRRSDASKTPYMPLGNDNCNTPLTDKYARELKAGATVETSSWSNVKRTFVPGSAGPTTNYNIPLNQSRNAQDFASAPLFVWYNEADKDNTVNHGNQDRDLAYGCMFKFTINDPALGPTKIYTPTGSAVSIFMDSSLVQALWTAGKRSFIGFNTRNIGGLPGHLADPWADFLTELPVVATTLEPYQRYQITITGTTDWTLVGSVNSVVGTVFTSTAVAGLGTGTAQKVCSGFARPSNWLNTASTDPYGKGTGCGFDIHFNAYGTSCIALYTGYLDGDKYAVSKLKQHSEVPGIGTVHEVQGEYYWDRGTQDPRKGPNSGVVTTQTSLRGITRATQVISKTPIPDIANGMLMTGAGVTDSCYVTSFQSDEKAINFSPPQTIAENVVLSFFVASENHTYENQSVSKYIRERYVGANQPLLNFDEKGERFNFQQLHSPLYIGNEANAGDGLTSVALEEGKQVLEINRRLMGNDFTPEMMPYKTPIKLTKTPTTTETPPIQPMNDNLIPWQVYDSDGGIFLENFGLTPAQWDLSLWGVLGFSYNQFHPTGAGNRQNRINNIIETTNLLVPTTNANLEASDVVKFRGNRYGSSLYTFQPPIGSVTGTSATAREQPSVDYPVIVIDQTSAQINAESLPRKMLKPFFLVKSNVIGDMSYWGGGDSGQNLPVVCVVNKENGFGDFYFQRGFDMEFTVTHPRMLTSITCSIHDPDMRLATCGPDSSLIFKITKMNHANLDVVQDVLQQQQQSMLKHKDKLKFMAEEEARAQARVRSQSPVTQRIGATEGLGDFVEPPGLSEMEQLGGNLATEHYGGESLAPAPASARIQSRNIGRGPARAVQQLSARPVDTNVLVSGPQGEQLQTTPILANISPAGGGMGNMPANMPQGLGPWRLTGTSEDDRMVRAAENNKARLLRVAAAARRPTPELGQRTTLTLTPAQQSRVHRSIGEGPSRRISQLSAEPVSTRVPVREEGSRANQNEAGRQPVGTLEERLQRARDAPR